MKDTCSTIILTGFIHGILGLLILGLGGLYKLYLEFDPHFLSLLKIPIKVWKKIVQSIDVLFGEVLSEPERSQRLISNNNIKVLGCI